MDAARYEPDQRPVGNRRMLLERTPEGSRVLDVGCWSGFAGDHLMGVRRAVVDGVEPDTGSAQRAASRYRRVLCSNVEPALDALIDEGARYDVLLFMDVLEHLVDPRAVLERSLGVLAPGGRALVSIPNVANWWIRKELLLGRWDYRDNGIMDRTHLRFFTFTSAAALLHASGWQITWQSASIDQPPLIRLPQRRLRLLARWPTVFGAQSLFEAIAHP